jgi:hypothetical protein
VIQRLEMPRPKNMAPENTSGNPAEIMPNELSEEPEGAAERVRDGLQKMSAQLIEVGREIDTVKGRLTRAQFRSWVSLACGISPAIARLMMRATGSAGSEWLGEVVRPRVPSRLIRALNEGSFVDRPALSKADTHSAPRSKMRGTMKKQTLQPVEAGLGIPVPHPRGGTLKNEERRRAGPPATLYEGIEQAFDVSKGNGKALERQAYPIRWLKQRYGLSPTYAAIVAAEFVREDA